MALPTLAAADAYGRTGSVVPATAADRPASAVSWGAIFAGAAAAAALSLILLILGSGLGLTSLSPYANAGASARTLGFAAIVWITVTQILASGMGGYLAGRLRTRWVATQTDEVYFRDTAHGFLAWAIASLATAALLSSAVGSVIGGVAQAGASAAGGAATAVAATAAGAGTAAVAGERGASGNAAGDMQRYFIDALFRKDAAAPSTPMAAPATGAMPSGPDASMQSAAPAAEVGRILMQAGGNAALPAEEVRYVGQLVAQRTGLSQQDAEKRVTDTVARIQAKAREAEAAARDAAEKARKATATATLWLFVSLLIGAFVASLCATYGGRERDL